MTTTEELTLPAPVATAEIKATLHDTVPSEIGQLLVAAEIGDGPQITAHKQS